MKFEDAKNVFNNYFSKSDSLTVIQLFDLICSIDEGYFKNKKIYNYYKGDFDKAVSDYKRLFKNEDSLSVKTKFLFIIGFLNTKEDFKRFVAKNYSLNSLENSFKNFKRVINSFSGKKTGFLGLFV